MSGDDPNVPDAPTSESAIEVPQRRRRDGSSDSEDDGARKRLLLLVPLVMAAAAIVALVLVGMQDKGTYSKDVDVLIAEKVKFVGKPVRTVGNLVHGSLVKRDSPCEYRFNIEKKGTEIPVRYAGCVVPDTFRDVQGIDVVVTVEGALRADNSFDATQVLAQCPSKYEMKQKAESGEKMPHPAGGMPAL
jgi:cytochrome c-type biogenesis protein CcmE